MASHIEQRKFLAMLGGDGRRPASENRVVKDTDDTNDFVVQLLRENRRLRKENERLAAIESSLWWRLHPRRHLRRITTAVRRSAPVPLPASTPEAPTPPPARDGLCSRFRREVVERGAFRRDWFTENVSSWSG
jgi:hypothetical protein